MVIKHPCKICNKYVAKLKFKLKCDNCDEWIHIKCNKIDRNPNPWYCIICMKLVLPFSNITDLDLCSTLAGKQLCFDKSKDLEVPSLFNTLFDNLNNISTLGSKYVDVPEFNSLNNKSKSYIHLNIASLPYHIDDLRILIGSLDTSPDIIAITESNLHKDDPNITNIDIAGYSTIHTPTEASKGGALLYIKSNLNYRVRNDLTIYKCKELESIFIEIINSKATNTIVGCIYRHPSMCSTEFIEDHLTSLIDKLNMKIKNTILMGDFNLDLLKHSSTKVVSEFLETLTSNTFFPFITQPTRITTHSKTLIDNIFMNFHSPDIISGNLTVSISDHLPQFVIFPSNDKPQENKPIIRRSFRDFNNEDFVNDIASCDWEKCINDDDDINDSITIFLKVFESILDKHAPFKELTNKQKLSLNKPWLTKA